MAQKLVAMFEFTKSTGGLPAQMRLAIKTGVPSSKAATEPDSPELIAKFKAAIKEITGKDAPGV